MLVIIGLIIGLTLWIRHKKQGHYNITTYSKDQLNSLRKRVDQQSVPSNNPDLRPINTTKKLVTENGLNFTICQTTKTVVLKPNAAYNFRKDFSEKTNPFMGKLKENLVITYDLNEKHRLLLNRYNILPKQLLIVAKSTHFETQNIPLDFYDMEGVYLVMKILENPVVFFNGGQSAGASQPHKHIQAIPLESFQTAHGCHLHERVLEFKKTCKEGEISYQIPTFQFKHQLRFFSQELINDLSRSGKNQKETTEKLLQIYQDMLESLGVDRSQPQYDTNVIITKTYMLIIVRSSYAHADIRKDPNLPPYRPNTMCFLGLFYSRTDELTNNFISRGMMNILSKCCVASEDPDHSSPKSKED